MSKSIYLYASGLADSALDDLVQRYGAAYGLPATDCATAPVLIAPQDWPSLVEGQGSDTLVRYWSVQTRRLGEMLTEAFPPAEASTPTAAVLSVLAEPWQGLPARSVVWQRTWADHGVVLAFAGMTIDARGRLMIGDAALPLPPYGAFEAPAPVLTDGSGSQVQQAMWVILQYIGKGLSAGEPPIIGTIFSVLLDLLKIFTSTASSQMDQLLADIKKLLQEDRIQIEMDDANAMIQTWADYEGSHFQESDLDLLNQANPDKSSQAYKDAAARIGDFVTKIDADLNGTPRLFDAVNLMRGDPQPNPESYDFPTDAMLKFSYFMFYSGFILALGKQAWLASRALNGVDAPVTQSLAHQVSYYSKTYTDYVTTLATAVRQQVNTRVSRWFISDEAQLDAHTFWIIQDRTQDRLARYYPPKEWGYTGDTVFSYCGNAQYQTAHDQCAAALQALIKCYQDYLYGRIVKSASDGRTMQQEFDARVAAFQDNDAKYQNLAASKS
jgi:hypothetical protein